MKWKISNDKEINFEDSKIISKEKLIKPHLMGILNATPDSFSDGGNFSNLRSAILQISRMIKEGATIIDIGGESTRPKSASVSFQTEIERVLPIFEEISKDEGLSKGAIFSVDTYKYETAKACLENGAKIVNDISALSDKKMAGLIASSKCGLVLMHMQGRPDTMQDNPKYNGVIDNLLDFFEKKIKYAVKNGIDLEQIAIDPGIGFGKKLEHNLEIFKNLDRFVIFDRPLILGLSKKSLIPQMLNQYSGSFSNYDYEKFENRKIPTVALSTLCQSFANSFNQKNKNGTKLELIMRVHDVKENLQAIEACKAFQCFDNIKT